MENFSNTSLASFKYFDSLFQNTVENNVLLISTEGIIISINTAFCKNFGYDEADLKGKYFAILFTEEDKVASKPEIEIKRVLKNGQAADNNYLVTKNKTVIWVSGESVLVKNEEGGERILKIIQDINLQKTSERLLTRSDALNDKILKSISDAVAVLDKDLFILSANTSFNTLFSIADYDKRVNFAEILRAIDLFGDVLRNTLKAATTHKGYSNLPVEIKTGTQDNRFYDVSCNPIALEPESYNLLIVIHDITAHKQIEREREDVIGFVAHELRNPLANLVLCNELMGDLIEENNKEGIADILQRSKNNVSRLNKMIAELYDAAKANSGNLKLDITTFNFEKMIYEAIDTIKVLQPVYNISVSGNGNINIQGDHYKLIQVVTNYLSNGIKYSDGNINVLLNMSFTDDIITVAVKDEGLGISPRQLPFIFDRFFRAEKTKNMEGIGLGLYLCRQIINAHHGNVWAESEEGKGSTFYFSIPRK